MNTIKSNLLLYRIHDKQITKYWNSEEKEKEKALYIENMINCN
jgi:hypothetical protein